MSKYKNKLTEVDGIVFHSKQEAKYYSSLKWLKANNMIKSFELQPEFVLQDSFKKNGKTYRKITYKADFKVTDKEGKTEIIDIKGFSTPLFELKRKIFEKKFPDLSLKVIKYVKKYGGWITDDEYKKIKRLEKQASKKVGE